MLKVNKQMSNVTKQRLTNDHCMACVSVCTRNTGIGTYVTGAFWIVWAIPVYYLAVRGLLSDLLLLFVLVFCAFLEVRVLRDRSYSRCLRSCVGILLVPRLVAIAA